jgi:hypothetical protein
VIVGGLIASSPPPPKPPRVTIGGTSTLPRSITPDSLINPSPAREVGTGDPLLGPDSGGVLEDRLARSDVDGLEGLPRNTPGRDVCPFEGAPRVSFSDRPAEDGPPARFSKSDVSGESDAEEDGRDGCPRNSEGGSPSISTRKAVLSETSASVRCCLSRVKSSNPCCPSARGRCGSDTSSSKSACVSGDVVAPVEGTAGNGRSTGSSNRPRRRERDTREPPAPAPNWARSSATKSTGDRLAGCEISSGVATVRSGTRRPRTRVAKSLPMPARRKRSRTGPLETSTNSAPGAIIASASRGVASSGGSVRAVVSPCEASNSSLNCSTSLASVRSILVRTKTPVG